MRHLDIGHFKEALDRLDVLLADREPGFAESLNPPAANSEIEALRAAVEPYELIEEIELLYRWHNGQNRGAASWWPLLQGGPLLTAAEAVEHRKGMADACEPWQWSASWLPITHSSWNQSAVELGEPLQGIVIDAGFPDGPTVQAESLAAVIQAMCSLIEAGIQLYAPATSGPESLDWMRQRNEALAVRRAPVLQWRYPVERSADADSQT